MKKIIMMLVTMSMILSLVACGNSKETGSSETDIENNSTVANESTEKVSEQEIENNSTNTSDSKEDVEKWQAYTELSEFGLSKATIDRLVEHYGSADILAEKL